MNHRIIVSQDQSKLQMITLNTKKISHLELVGGVEGHFHRFLEAITVIHNITDSELSELQQSCLWRISHHEPLCEMVKVRWIFSYNNIEKVEPGGLSPKIT